MRSPGKSRRGRMLPEVGVAERVGIFDSGVGGLSVWRQIARQLPGVETLYVADQAHIPYGARRDAEVLAFARGITNYLAAQRCRAVVVACNTASAVALQNLRRDFPDVLFVGMEPAVKPAALVSRSRVVGVLATSATLAGELFRTTLAQHATDVQIVRQACPGLVERIESGELNGAALETMLRGFLRAPLAAGADVLVLACTHYPLVQEVIAKLAGPAVQVIDPAPAIARQLGRCLGLRPGAVPAAAARHFRTTGEVRAFEQVAGWILGSPVRASTLHWRDGELRETQRAEKT